MKYNERQKLIMYFFFNVESCAQDGVIPLMFPFITPNTKY